MKIDDKYLREYYSGFTSGSYTRSTKLHYTAKIVDEKDKVRELYGSIQYLNENESHICFGSLLQSTGSLKTYITFREDEKLKIIVNVPTTYAGNSNSIFTWMKAGELKEVVQDFVELFPSRLHVLSVDVEEKKGSDGLYLIIYADKQISRIEQKLVLFWARNAIKWPYNLLLANAIKLKNEYYPEDTLYNLLSVVIFGTAYSSEKSYSWCENWSCWGPFISPEEIEQQIGKGKTQILGISDNGILPHIGYYEYTREGYPEIKQMLEKELKFRKEIWSKLGRLKEIDSSSGYKPLIFLENEEVFDLYREIYDVKHTLKPLYM